MLRVGNNDVFTVRKRFSFCGVSYDRLEDFIVARVYKSSASNGGYAIQIQDVLGNNRITMSAEKFGEYLRDGYFTETKLALHTEQPSYPTLQVGDIIQTKTRTMTVVEDVKGHLCAIDHEDFEMLYITDFKVGMDYLGGLDIEKVYRMSKVNCEDEPYGTSVLTHRTQIYPVSTVKLTLSQIQKKFQIENQNVEIDFEN